MGGYRSRSRRLIAALGIVITAALGGCAVVPDDPEARWELREINDPIEPINRRIFTFNLLLDKLVLRPLAEGYGVLPETPRKGITNFLRNIGSPVTLANDLLQAKARRAATTAVRFAINSIFGIGGLFDVATRLGWERHSEDFGQTLGYYGVPEGPYLVLPVLGPAPPRDAIGLVADYLLDPVSYLGLNSGWEWVSPTLSTLEAIDFRTRHFDEIDDTKRTAIDLYATVRSAYRQSRDHDILDGIPGPLVPVPQISIDFSDQEATE